jgi:hypothetical protein
VVACLSKRELRIELRFSVGAERVGIVLQLAATDRRPDLRPVDEWSLSPAFFRGLRAVQ